MGDSDEMGRAELHARRAHRSFRSGQFSQAEQELRRALRFDPNRGDWRCNLAVTLELGGKHAEALVEYAAAADLLNGHLDAHLGAARCAGTLGRHDDALRWACSALEFDRLNEMAHAIQIEALSHLGRHEEAEQAYFVCQQYLDRYPWALRAMGDSLLRRGRHSRASWCFREALTQAPDLEGGRVRLGMALLAAGEAARAAQVFLQAIRADPSDADALLGSGAALQQLGQTDAAAERFRRILEMEPAHMGAHLRLAELAMSGGNFEEARAAFVVAISVGTPPAGARVRLAHCLLRLGDGDGARTQLAEERALPDFEARQADLATTPALALEATAVAVACKDFEFAQGVSTAALAAHPVDLQLLRRDCRISMEQGNLQLGLRKARRILRAHPTDAETLHNFALAALKLRRPRWALAVLHRARTAGLHERSLRAISTRLHLAHAPALIAALGRSWGARLLAALPFSAREN